MEICPYFKEAYNKEFKKRKNLKKIPKICKFLKKPRTFLDLGKSTQPTFSIYEKECYLPKHGLVLPIFCQELISMAGKKKPIK